MTPQVPNPTPENDKPPVQASLGAIALIAIGALLFLQNLGVPAFASMRAYWPLAMAAWGLVLLSRGGDCATQPWPWALMAAGVLLTLGNLNIIHVNGGAIWPIFLIAAGISMLINRNRGVGNMWGGWCGRPGMRLRRRMFGSSDRLHVAFGTVNRRVETVNFEGADYNSSFGELKVDLRNATISTATRQATIYTHASFGAIKIRVPETWKVVVLGTAVFGAYEDKTVPPRPVPGFDPPTLIIRGSAAFGAVEIEN